MAKKRSPTWPRGAPRTEPQSINPSLGGTADVEFVGARTVEGTSDRSAPPGGTFTAVPAPAAPPRKWLLSAEGTGALIAAIVLFGTITLYVAGIKSDVAVVSTRVDALQKSHDGETTTLREEIRRVERALDTRLNRLLDFLPGRREPEPTRRKSEPPRQPR